MRCVMFVVIGFAAIACTGEDRPAPKVSTDAGLKPYRPPEDARAEVELEVPPDITAEDLQPEPQDAQATEREAGAPPAPAEPPPGRISLADKQALDKTSLSAEAVVGSIQSRYMAGLKRCYRAALTIDPQTSGPARLAFTVLERGRAGQASVTAPTPELAACFERLIAMWTFQTPRGEDSEPTATRFVLTLTLSPQ